MPQDQDYTSCLKKKSWNGCGCCCGCFPDQIL